MTMILKPAPCRPAAPVKQTLKSYKITYTVRSGMRGHYNLMARSAGEAKWAMVELLPQARVVSVLEETGDW